MSIKGLPCHHHHHPGFHIILINPASSMCMYVCADVVMNRLVGVWSQLQRLTGSDVGSSFYFGSAASIHANTLVHHIRSIIISPPSSPCPFFVPCPCLLFFLPF